MTGGLLLGIYLVVLATFLGWDLVGKVPATMYALILGGAGTVSGVVILAALYVPWDGCSGIAVTLAAAGAVGGMTALTRSADAFHKKSGPT